MTINKVSSKCNITLFQVCEGYSKDSVKLIIFVVLSVLLAGLPLVAYWLIGNVFYILYIYFNNCYMCHILATVTCVTYQKLFLSLSLSLSLSLCRSLTEKNIADYRNQKLRTRMLHSECDIRSAKYVVVTEGRWTTRCKVRNVKYYGSKSSLFLMNHIYSYTNSDDTFLV